MTALDLFGHPFSAYTWKVLIPLYENGTAFRFRRLGEDQPENGAALAAHWPLAQFPLLLDDGRPVIESSVIIEHLDHRHPGPLRLIPADADAAIEVRMLDRIFDNHVMNQMQRVVNDALRPPERRDPLEVADAKARLERAYAWLESWMGSREWAAAGAFTLADCAAAPALFYADWVHPIAAEHARLRTYRTRLLARPSIAKCVDDARPYRPLFPLGAPDRD
ncbi:glutathione S-transferase family protein [Sphingomonas sp. HT-1]|uniref:glutathione S-transferase family protein n=1 Tax=unclassified Sphingomonas TaxID=196159 RepID=UPI0002F34AAB|nr:MULTISPECIES: glutathione S-transferase family protein [unclassified Sphingomonas]KTF68855.1 glutathione S-transferase [Sphingomonas sp. WG]